MDVEVHQHASCCVRRRRGGASRLGVSQGEYKVKVYRAHPTTHPASAALKSAHLLLTRPSHSRTLSRTVVIGAVGGRSARLISNGQVSILDPSILLS